MLIKERDISLSRYFCLTVSTASTFPTLFPIRPPRSYIAERRRDDTKLVWSFKLFSWSRLPMLGWSNCQLTIKCARYEWKEWPANEIRFVRITRIVVTHFLCRIETTSDTLAIRKTLPSQHASFPLYRKRSVCSCNPEVYSLDSRKWLKWLGTCSTARNSNINWTFCVSLYFTVRWLRVR